MLLRCIFIIACLFQIPAGIAQKHHVILTGLVQPANENWPVKRLRQAEVLVTELGKDDTIAWVRTDDSGFFKMDLFLESGQSSLYVFVSARNGQRVVTIDSICPYNVFRTPKGYFDYTEPLFINDTHTNIYREFGLRGGLYHPNPYYILFRKQSLEIIDYKLRHPDTVLQCLRNSYIHFSKNLMIRLCLEVPANDKAAANLAKRRAAKIAIKLKKDYKIPKKNIEIQYNYVEKFNPDAIDELGFSLIYITLPK